MESSSSKTPTKAAVSIEALDSLDPETFDWTTFNASYKGRALITRLLFITSLIDPNKPCTARRLGRTAAVLVIPLLKETWDIENYTHAVAYVARCGPEGAAEGECTEAKTGTPDQVWVDETTPTARLENSRLAVELNGYMSNLIKESIRLTYIAMANVSLKEGNLQAALGSFQHVREYSAGPVHHVDLGLAIINAALSYNEPLPLAGNIPKVEAMVERLHPLSASAPISSTMTAAEVQLKREMEEAKHEARRAVGVELRVARAVLALSNNDYQRAARELGEIGEEGGLGKCEGQAMSTPDVAFICAICTLATGSRDHIRRVLTDRASFHTSLGDHQGWVLDLVRAFVEARYSEALTLLRKAEPYMLLNPLLSAHTPDLLSRIRTRGIVQYLSPFSSVRVSAMATAFGTDEDAMLAEVCALAERGDIPVKVDLVDRVLRIDERDPRAQAFRKAIEGGSATTALAIGSTFRMRLKEAGVIVGGEKRDRDRDVKAK